MTTSTATTTIRPMRAADAAAVVRLIKGLADDQGSKAVIKPAALLAEYKRAGTVTLVAELRGSVVGYLISTRRFNFEFAVDEWKMDYLFVAAKYRSHGIGQMLIADWAARAKKAKVGIIRTAARKTNTGADKLYRAMGFNRSAGDSNRYIAYGDAITKMAGE